MTTEAMTNDDELILRTDRLRLRELQLSRDELFILELLNEPGFVRFVGDKGVRTLEDAARYIQSQIDSYRTHGFGLYLVEVSEMDAPIGICGLLRREAVEDVEIGFGYLESSWGRGYALEASSAVLAWGFETFDLPRVVALTAPDNRGSIRVIEKLGMRFERLVPLPGFDVERKLFVTG